MQMKQAVTLLTGVFILLGLAAACASDPTPTPIPAATTSTPTPLPAGATPLPTPTPDTFPDEWAALIAAAQEEGEIVLALGDLHAAQEEKA